MSFGGGAVTVAAVMVSSVMSIFLVCGVAVVASFGGFKPEGSFLV